jgi:hypothetical protein
LRGIEWRGEFSYVDQMVRDTAAFLRGGLGSAEVESAIDLHGIDGDDFAIQFFGERERDL